jgi:hypothetical protein
MQISRCLTASAFSSPRCYLSHANDQHSKNHPHTSLAARRRQSTAARCLRRWSDLSEPGQSPPSESARRGWRPGGEAAVARSARDPTCLPVVPCASTRGRSSIHPSRSEIPGKVLIFPAKFLMRPSVLDLGCVFRRLLEYHTRLRMMRSLGDSLHARIAARLEAKVGHPPSNAPSINSTTNWAYITILASYNYRVKISHGANTRWIYLNQAWWWRK